ncbi:MAG: four helix bundle protein [Planctomycetota bacterium]
MHGNAARSFEELHIYQRARELTNGVYSITREGAFARDFGLVNQLRRAVVSVMSNIAEGFERGTSVEFIQFLYIAKGSCGEVRAQLQVATDQNYMNEDTYQTLTTLARKTSGMISNFIAHLQATDYRGDKFARPQRQAISRQEVQRAKVRESQLVNMQREQEHRPSDPRTE